MDFKKALDFYNEKGFNRDFLNKTTPEAKLAIEVNFCIELISGELQKTCQPLWIDLLYDDDEYYHYFTFNFDKDLYPIGTECEIAKLRDFLEDNLAVISDSSREQIYQRFEPFLFLTDSEGIENLKENLLGKYLSSKIKAYDLDKKLSEKNFKKVKIKI